MAVKSWHITVMNGMKTVESKTFFKVGEADEHLVKMKEKYPKDKFPGYSFYRENY